MIKKLFFSFSIIYFIFSISYPKITINLLLSEEKLYAQIKNNINIKEIGGIKFVKIPSGSFMMGSVESEGEYDEHPLHKVTLDGFWIGIYEVTQKQYKELFETHSSCFEGDNLPVEEVNIKDIMEFCMKFNKKYKVKVRLPTEAEWEYACRAGTITKYYWGNEINADYCWYRGNSGNQTHPVGEKKPNAWGLHDTCGNVREWCMDYYREDYYKKSPEKNPEGPKYLQSYLEYPNAFCVQRGGSYHRDEWCLRSAARTSALLSEQSHNVGFRLVLEIPE